MTYVEDKREFGKRGDCEEIGCGNAIVLREGSLAGEREGTIFCGIIKGNSPLPFAENRRRKGEKTAVSSSTDGEKAVTVKEMRSDGVKVERVIVGLFGERAMTTIVDDRSPIAIDNVRINGGIAVNSGEVQAFDRDNGSSNAIEGRSLRGAGITTNAVR